MPKGPAVRDLLCVCLEDHRALWRESVHGPEKCDWCSLFAALAIVAQAAGVLDAEAVAVQPVGPPVEGEDA